MPAPDPSKLSPAQEIEALKTSQEKTSGEVTAINEQLTGLSSTLVTIQEQLAGLVKSKTDGGDSKGDQKATSEAPKVETPAAGSFDPDALVASIVEKVSASFKPSEPTSELESTEGDSIADQLKAALDPITTQISELKTELETVAKGKDEADRTKSPGPEGTAADPAGSSEPDAAAGGEGPTWLDTVLADKTINTAGATAEQLDAHAFGEDYTVNLMSDAEVKYGSESDFKPKKDAE